MPDLQGKIQNVKASAPKVALMPYAYKRRGSLRDVPLRDLDWPLGVPVGIEGKTLADLEPTDHLLTYPRFWIYSRAARKLAVKISVMIVEPRSFHGYHLRMTSLFRTRFHKVFTADDKLLASLSNAASFVFGDSWIAEEETYSPEKTEMVSLIASRKNALEGHRLRHQVVKAAKQQSIELAVMGAGYNPFDRKSDGLAPYRFSVVIENSSEPRYFTEKLVDAFLCETVPIYWGATRISEYFDPSGMIICSSKDEIMKALGSLSQEQYLEMRPAIERNKIKARDFLAPEKRAAKLLLAS